MLELLDKDIKKPEKYPKVERVLPTIKDEGYTKIGGKLLKKGYDFAYQPGMQETMMTTDVDVLFLGGQPGGGKALIISELVLTPEGFVKNGDLKVGDTITGVDGKPQKVLGVYDQGEKDVYRLHFIDGSHLDCTEDHLWKVRRSGYQTKPHRKSSSEDRVEESWRIINMKDIMRLLDNEAKRKKLNPGCTAHNLLIPLCDPVQFDIDYDLEIDPYILGLILGDGCITGSDSNNISFAKYDKQIIDSLSDFFNIRYEEGKLDYSFRSKEYREKFEALGLWGTYSDTKFIPEKYKYASIEDRRALICGLMDIGGCVDSLGHMSYCTTSERLAKDFKFIINSLGGKAAISENQGKYKDKEGKVVVCKKSYTLHIQTRFNKDLVRLERKKERCVDGFNGGYSPLCRRITGYEYIGKDECRCIKVSNPDNLYIAGEGFVVTHNTFGILLSALDGVEKPGYGALIIKKQLVSTKETAGSIIQDAKRVYSNYADCQFSSSDYPTFAFPTWGTSISFTHSNFDATTEKRAQEAQEKAKNFQCSHIFFDELTDFDYRTWSYWLSRNRDSSGVPSKMICTFNTNSHHFTRRMIDWYIDENGQVIPERIGKVRYFLMRGDSEEGIIWGNTKEEVVRLGNIEVTEDLKAIGMSNEDMVKSFTFMPCKMSENRALMNATKGGHAANIFNLGEEETNKLFYENWNEEGASTSRVSKQAIRNLFTNPYDESYDEMFATLDVSGGGDLCSMLVWKGLRLIKIEVFEGGYDKLERWIRPTLSAWNVPVENLAIDTTGLGQYLKSYITNARHVTYNTVAIKEYDEAGNAIEAEKYYNVRSQLIAKTEAMIMKGEMTIDIDRNAVFPHGTKRIPKILEDILIEESNIFKRTERNGRLYYLNKKEFISKYRVSPDIMDSICLRSVFELQNVKRKEKEVVFTESDYNLGDYESDVDCEYDMEYNEFYQ
ncbi:hypothetical protein PF672P1_00065 [Parabacteroides phage PF672P1]|nr:hypothetical protein PF672P1_00065 [Parabacteroides phage PF672P1]